MGVSPKRLFSCRAGCVVVAGCDFFPETCVAAHRGCDHGRGRRIDLLWAQTHPDSATAVVNKVPFGTKQMFLKVDMSFQTRGLSAVYVGPLTGTPYKIYAVAAPRFEPFPSFLFATILARFILVSLFSGACAGALRKYGNASLRQLTRWHALAWTAFYIFYWMRIVMR